jgi:hypothetical protein
MYHSKATSKNKRRQWKNTLAGDTFQTFHPYIDIFGCGEWWDDAPHWSITDEVREAYRNDPTGENAKRYHTGKLKAKRIDQGIQFDDQYYTCARQGLSLLYLDIDDHLPHQTDKAELTAAVVNLLGAEYLFENEGRLWIKAEWHREDYQTFRKVYTAFLDALRIWARSQGFQSDIDTPKGIDRHLGRLPLKNWNYGKLETFKCTRHVSIDKLKAWTEKLHEQTRTKTSEATEETTGKKNPVILNMGEIVARRIREGGRAGGTDDAGRRCSERRTDAAGPGVSAGRSRLSRERSVISCKSISGVPFDLDEVSDILNSYKPLAYKVMNAQQHRHDVAGQNLFAIDTQCTLTILHLARLYPNPDGSMPTARAKAWWTILYHEGIFPRGYDPSKWAAITRLLACCGVTNVVDNNYWYYADDQNRKGQAMKYHIKDAYLVTDSGEGEASLEDVVLVYHPQLWQPRGQARIYRYFWLDPPDEILSEAA